MYETDYRKESFVHNPLRYRSATLAAAVLAAVLAFYLGALLFLSIRTPYPRTAHLSIPHQPLGARLLERYWFTPVSQNVFRRIVDTLVPTVYAQMCPVGGSRPSCEGRNQESYLVGEKCHGQGCDWHGLPYPGRGDCPNTACQATSKSKLCGQNFEDNCYSGCLACPYARDQKCNP